MMRKNLLCMCIGVGASLIGLRENYTDKLTLFYNAYNNQEFLRRINASRRNIAAFNDATPFHQVSFVLCFESILIWAWANLFLLWFLQIFNECFSCFFFQFPAGSFKFRLRTAAIRRIRYKSNRWTKERWQSVSSLWKCYIRRITA